MDTKGILLVQIKKPKTVKNCSSNELLCEQSLIQVIPVQQPLEAGQVTGVNKKPFCGPNGVVQDQGPGVQDQDLTCGVPK